MHGVVVLLRMVMMVVMAVYDRKVSDRNRTSIEHIPHGPSISGDDRVRSDRQPELAERG